MVRPFSDTLLRLAGGGPSRSDCVLESMPSGIGEPLSEVCCDEGGEGYGPELRRDEVKWIMSGGVGLLDSSESGEEGTLDSGDESALDSEAPSILPGVLCRVAIEGRRGSGGANA